MAEPTDNGVERRIVNEARFTKLEEQSSRLVSDAESEKATRRRTNIDLKLGFDKVNGRLDKIEERQNAMLNKMYWFSGALAVFVFIIQWYFRR